MQRRLLAIILDRFRVHKATAVQLPFAPYNYVFHNAVCELAAATSAWSFTETVRPGTR